MEKEKLSGFITKNEFVGKCMVSSNKTEENFLTFESIYDKLKNKELEIYNDRFIFDDVSFKTERPVKETKPDAMKISLIAAIGKNNELGTGPDLIWKISEDLKRFKELTSNHYILMGRKTFDTFKNKEGVIRPLPNRIHLVITRDKELLKNDKIELLQKNVFYFENINDAINFADDEYKLIDDDFIIKDKIFVIGGGEIYKQTIHLADELFITRITSYSLDADIFFPVIDYDVFQYSSNKVSEITEFVNSQNKKIILPAPMKIFYSDLIRKKESEIPNKSISISLIKTILIKHIKQKYQTNIS